jgi:hypothetical protein
MRIAPSKRIGSGHGEPGELLKLCGRWDLPHRFEGLIIAPAPPSLTPDRTPTRTEVAPLSGAHPEAATCYRPSVLMEGLT